MTPKERAQAVANFISTIRAMAHVATATMRVICELPQANVTFAFIAAVDDRPEMDMVISDPLVEGDELFPRLREVIAHAESRNKKVVLEDLENGPCEDG